MQRITVTLVAFGLDSLPLLLLWWDIFQLRIMLILGHSFIFISLFAGGRHLQMATTTASELVLSTCPKHVLSKLPALSTTADEHTDRCTLGSDAMSFACASKNLEIKCSSICGESSASAGAISSLLCYLLQSNVTKIGDFLWQDILEGYIWCNSCFIL